MLKTQSIFAFAPLALTTLVSLVFATAGAAKILGAEQAVLPFERMGLPFLAFAVGALEIVGAIGLFLPRVRQLAALGLSATMVGAIIYHVTLAPDKAAVPAVVLLVLCATLAWIHRSQPA